MEIPAITQAQQTLGALQPDVAALDKKDDALELSRRGGDRAGGAAKDDGFGPSVVVNLSAQAVQALGQSQNDERNSRGEENDTRAGLTDAQGFSALISRLSQTVGQRGEANNIDANGNAGDGLKLPPVNGDEGENNVARAQVEDNGSQGAPGANILAAANNQEQSGAQDIRDLFDNSNDDQKELS